MLEFLQSVAFKLYQRNLVEKAKCYRDSGLSSIDKFMDEGNIPPNSFHATAFFSSSSASAVFLPSSPPRG